MPEIIYNNAPYVSETIRLSGNLTAHLASDNTVVLGSAALTGEMSALNLDSIPGTLDAAKLYGNLTVEDVVSGTLRVNAGLRAGDVGVYVDPDPDFGSAHPTISFSGGVSRLAFGPGSAALDTFVGRSVAGQFGGVLGTLLLADRLGGQDSAWHRDRANHTGTQAFTTLSGTATRAQLAAQVAYEDEANVFSHTSGNAFVVTSAGAETFPQNLDNRSGTVASAVGQRFRVATNGGTVLVESLATLRAGPIGEYLLRLRSTAGGAMRDALFLPSVAPAAIVQTYATTSRTLAAYTPDVESADYTGQDNAQAGTVYAKLADLNALRAAYETLRALVENGTQVMNAVIDDLQVNKLLS